MPTVSLRSIQAFGKKVTGWQVLPVDASDFEEAALRAGELIVASDRLTHSEMCWPCKLWPAHVRAALGLAG